MTEQDYLTHIENCIREIRAIDMSNSWAYEQVIHYIEYHVESERP